MPSVYMRTVSLPSCPEPKVNHTGLASALNVQTCACYGAKHFTLTMPLFTQVYKWVPEFTAGVALRWTSFPSRGENRIKHEAEGRVLLLLRGVWKP